MPEKREELTTEGGLDVVAHKIKVKDAVKKLQDRGIHVSLFIDPVQAQIEAAKEVGAHAIEIHTGAYCNVATAARQRELARDRGCGGVGAPPWVWKCTPATA